MCMIAEKQLQSPLLIQYWNLPHGDRKSMSCLSGGQVGREKGNRCSGETASQMQERLSTCEKTENYCTQGIDMTSLVVKHAELSLVFGWDVTDRGFPLHFPFQCHVFRHARWQWFLCA